MEYKGKPSLFEEIKQMRRFFKIPKKKRDIVFYTEHGDYWIAFEGLIKELNEKHKKTVFYITSDWRDPVLHTKNSKIQSFYINKLLLWFMLFIDSRVVIMTLTDLGNHTVGKSRRGVHYVYIFHALVSTHMIYQFGAFDQYDSILCVGPHHIKEIRKREEKYNLKPKTLVEAGYFRLEKLIDEYQKYLLNAKSRDKKIILLAPSWGDKNILETCGHELTRVLLQAGYHVIIRPHSEIVKRSPDLIRELEKEFGTNPHCTLETSNATNNSMLIADALISDYSGIALEYFMGVGRPVISVDVPPKIKNERFKELGIEPLELTLRTQIGKTVSPQNVRSVPALIEELLKNGEYYKKKSIRLRKEHVFNLGTSSKVGAEYILRLGS